MKRYLIDVLATQDLNEIADYWFFLTWYAKLTIKMPRIANIYFCSFQNF